MTNGRYEIKCDDCKGTIDRTDNVQESFAGGICATCKGTSAFYGTNPDLMDAINDYYGYWMNGVWNPANGVTLAETISAAGHVKRLTGSNHS